MEIVKTMPFQVADITNYLSTKLILDETFQVYHADKIRITNFKQNKILLATPTFILILLFATKQKPSNAKMNDIHLKHLVVV